MMLKISTQYLNQLAEFQQASTKMIVKQLVYASILRHGFHQSKIFSNITKSGFSIVLLFFQLSFKNYLSGTIKQNYFISDCIRFFFQIFFPSNFIIYKTMIKVLSLLMLLIPKVTSLMASLNTTSCLRCNGSYNFRSILAESNYLTTVEFQTASVSTFLLTYTIAGAQPVFINVSTFYYNAAAMIPVVYGPNIGNTSGSAILATVSQYSVDLYDVYNVAYHQSLDFSSLPNIMVRKICFGNTGQEIFMIADFYQAGFYGLGYFNAAISLGPQAIKNLTLSTMTQIDKMLCKNNKIYISLLNRIIMFSMNSSFVSLGSYSYPTSTSIYNIDFQVTQSLLIYMTRNSLVVINESTNTTLRTVSYGTNNSLLQIIDDTYLVFANYTDLTQYDYVNGFVMSTAPLVLTNTQLRLFLYGGALIIARNLNAGGINSDTQYHFYSQTPSYSCPSCTSCYPTYTLMPGDVCMKIPPVPIPSSSMNSSNSSIFNSSNSLQSYNDEVQRAIAAFFLSSNSQWNMGFGQSISTILIASSLKFSPQFLISLLLPFDDISRYVYHNKKYPQSVKFFLNSTFTIIKDKLDPWMLNLINFFSQSIDYANINNVRNRKYLAIQSLKGVEVFFTKSVAENYKNGYFLTFTIFFVIKLFQLCLLISKCDCCKSVYKYIKRCALLIVFVSSLVESNFTQLAFDFGVQVQIPSYYDFFQKTNFITCVLVMFVITAYAFSFYPMVYCTASKVKAKMLLMPCKYKMQSYFYQPCLMLVRTGLRAFLHSFLLRNYTSQILALFASNLFFLLLCLRMRKYFHNCLIFVLYTLYTVLFSAFDLFFYLQSIKLTSNQTRRQLFGLVLIGCLILTCIFISCAFFLEACYKSIKKKCHKITKTDDNQQSNLSLNKKFQMQRLKSQTIQIQPSNVLPLKKYYFQNAFKDRKPVIRISTIVAQKHLQDNKMDITKKSPYKNARKQKKSPEATIMVELVKKLAMNQKQAQKPKQYKFSFYNNKLRKGDKADYKLNKVFNKSQFNDIY